MPAGHTRPTLATKWKGREGKKKEARPRPREWPELTWNQLTWPDLTGASISNRPSNHNVKVVCNPYSVIFPCHCNIFIWVVCGLVGPDWLDHIFIRLDPTPSHASFTTQSSCPHLHGNSSPVGPNVTIPNHLSHLAPWACEGTLICVCVCVCKRKNIIIDAAMISKRWY